MSVGMTKRGDDEHRPLEAAVESLGTLAQIGRPDPRRRS
jgi:hypothetical protein